MGEKGGRMGEQGVGCWPRLRADWLLGVAVVVADWLLGVAVVVADWLLGVAVVVAVASKKGAKTLKGLVATGSNASPMGSPRIEGLGRNHAQN